MKLIKIISLLLFLFIFMLSGCLKVEKKLYSFQVNKDGSGKGTVIYHNIYSENDEEGSDDTKADFETLINDYIEGTTFEDEHPGLDVSRKRLYEDDGVLCGEVNFTFDEYAATGLYQHDSKSPWMWWPGSEDEEYYDSEEGEYGGETMPIVFWTKNTKDFEVATTVGEFGEGCRSLLPRHNDWVRDN